MPPLRDDMGTAPSPQFRAASHMEKGNMLDFVGIWRSTGYQRCPVQDEPMLYAQREHDGTCSSIGGDTFRTATPPRPHSGTRR
ncbi:hypothetical protein [Streptomyces coeruleorubidus]|uniref:hypothetical protein n=1 Tax=Streptomyces coeruleorubidus TaxID=116188 RepID=UPI0033A5AB88